MSPDSLASRETTLITADSTVDAVIALVPAATSILNAHNIDTCCGGRASLGEAAAHARADLQVVIELLAAVPYEIAPRASGEAQPANSCGCGCK